jgi:hypothetical protein
MNNMKKRKSCKNIHKPDAYCNKCKVGFCNYDMQEDGLCWSCHFWEENKENFDQKNV